MHFMCVKNILLLHFNLLFGKAFSMYLNEVKCIVKYPLVQSKYYTEFYYKVSGCLCWNSGRSSMVCIYINMVEILV